MRHYTFTSLQMLLVSSVCPSLCLSLFPFSTANLKIYLYLLPMSTFTLLIYFKVKYALQDCWNEVPFLCGTATFTKVKCASSTYYSIRLCVSYAHCFVAIKMQTGLDIHLLWTCELLYRLSSGEIYLCLQPLCFPQARWIQRGFSSLSY